MTVLETLRSIVADEQVIEWEVLATDWQGKIKGAVGPKPTEPGLPKCLVFPPTEAALAAIMAACYRNRWRVLCCGQGSKLSWGKFSTGADVVVSTAHLNRVVDHWVQDFTVRAEAGVPWAMLQSKLQEKGQFLAIDPLFGSQATLGGIVATGDAGSLRQRYGGIRDMLIGVQFIRYDGQIVKAGGRVVKNVAGYDLMKLMIGAYGTLGILSQLTFRVFPIPARSQTIILTGEPEAIGKAALQVRQSGLTPVAMDILMGDFDIANVPMKLQGTGMALVGRFQGIEAGVEEQVNRFQAMGQALGLAVELLAEDTAFWQTLPTEMAPDEEGDILCKLGLLPTGIVGFLQQAAQQLPAGWRGRFHNGNGLGQMRWGWNGEAPGHIQRLRSHCEAHQGFLTVLQAPQSLKHSLEPSGYTGNTLDLMTALKAHFDPLHLLNPGQRIGRL